MRDKTGIISKFFWIFPPILYAVLVVCFHLHVLQNIGTKILAGWQVGGVVVWEGWWFRKMFELASGSSFSFSNIIFYPSGVPVFMHSPLNTFYFLLTKPWLDVYTAYNLLCLLSYVFVGWSMFILAFQVTRHQAAALFAGLIYMFNPENVTQHYLGQMGLANAFFVPLLYLGFIKFVEEPKPGPWFLFTIAFQGVVLTIPYAVFIHGFVGIPVCCAALWKKFTLKTERGRTLSLILVSYIIAGIIGSLAYAPMLLHARELIGGSEVYPLHPLSFFVYPLWHENGVARIFTRLIDTSSGGVTQMTQDVFGQSRLIAHGTAENQMGFITYTVMFMLVMGAIWRAFKGGRVWWSLVFAGAILSLGSDISFFSQKWHLPLPYLLFEKLPVLGQFRAPARMMEMAWVGLAVLTALAAASFEKRLKKKVVFKALLILAAFTFLWETGIVYAVRQVTPLRNFDLYQIIKSDGDKFGVLELPVSIDRYGDVTINAQLFMLHQPLHGKPLVVARPSRHTRNSLAFCEKTDFVYELTHPGSISQLYRDPALSGRLKELLKKGRRILTENNIKYVLFHFDEEFFPLDIRQDYAKFLSEALGKPAKSGDEGGLLFRVY